MEEERIGLFLDFENLAIGARGQLRGKFDFQPIADALAERGRVVVRRAYADWSMFDDGRRDLTRHHVELIEIPQKMGMVRKNAADIKLAVDAIELSFEREYITTFVIGTGDSDFTPLVHKLRELNKRVIGIGIEAATSALLPAACDEFLFYDRLPGVEAVPAARRGRGRSRPQAAVTPDPVTDPVTAPVPAPAEEPAPADEDSDPGPLITRTLAGLQRHADGPVLASRLKRAVLRKDPTFDEADHGFRGFGELLRHLESEHVLQLRAGSAQGDPEVTFPEDGPADDDAFGLLVDVVRQLQASGSRPQLSGLKDQLRKRRPDFSEKRYGFNTFLSFAKAARARNLIGMNWDEDT